MIIPAGKTAAVMLKDLPQCAIQRGASGYIDGYIQAADSRPYAVFVDAHGNIDMVPIHSIKATTGNSAGENDG